MTGIPLSTAVNIYGEQREVVKATAEDGSRHVPPTGASASAVGITMVTRKAFLLTALVNECIAAYFTVVFAFGVQLRCIYSTAGHSEFVAACFTVLRGVRSSCPFILSHGRRSVWCSRQLLIDTETIGSASEWRWRVLCEQRTRDSWIDTLVGRYINRSVVDEGQTDTWRKDQIVKLCTTATRKRF